MTNLENTGEPPGNVAVAGYPPMTPTGRKRERKRPEKGIEEYHKKRGKRYPVQWEN